MTTPYPSQIMGIPVVRRPAATGRYNPLSLPKSLAIIHDIEGSASSAANTFQSPPTGDESGSTHFIADPANHQFIQCVAATEQAYASGNSSLDARGISLELPGFSGQQYDPAVLDYAARFLAWCNQDSGIPLTFLNLHTLSTTIGAAGVTQHDNVPDPSNPSVGGGRYHHSDPGPTYPSQQVIDNAVSIITGGGAAPVQGGTKSGVIFPTGFSVGADFRDTWNAFARHDNDTGVAAAITLFGYPVCRPYTDTGVAPRHGGHPLVQWFERARMERWPNGEITLGRVGAELWEQTRQFVPPEYSVKEG